MSVEMRFEWNGKTPTKQQHPQTKEETSKEKHQNPHPHPPPHPLFSSKKKKNDKNN